MQHGIIGQRFRNADAIDVDDYYQRWLRIF